MAWQKRLPRVRQGMLLVSTPLIKDPHFDRSVVYILRHNQDGSLGVILNHPAPEELQVQLRPEVSELFPFVKLDSLLCMIGGPVATREQYILLGYGIKPPRAPELVEISDGIYSMDLSETTESAFNDLIEVRLYCGYAGWDAGQLESELLIGGWVVLEPVGIQDIFCDPGCDLWAKVLKRQGGKLAAMANYPENLSVN